MSFKDIEVSEASSYLKLVTGENRLRIVSEAIPRWVAWKDSKSMNFLTKEAADKHNNSCTDEKQKAKPKYAMWVINRASDEILCADFGVLIMKALKNLANDSEYGFEGLPSYDIKITKTGEGMDTEYAVLPLPAKPLTEEELRRIDAQGKLMDFLRPMAADANSVAPF